MSLQTMILADLVRRERDREEVPKRQERRRITRLAEAIAACCRPLTFAGLRARLRRDRDPSCACA
jgi:DNA-binding MarR family transcriptional regulator